MFKYHPVFPAIADETEYELWSGEGVSFVQFSGRRFLQIESGVLESLSEEAFRRVNFFLRESHNSQVAAILKDPESSDNDRFVARAMLENAAIAAEGILPFCQDTGTATVIGWKGQHVISNGDDLKSLSHGIYRAYSKHAFRHSQMAPLSMYEEKNTADNLPAQIDIFAVSEDSPGNEEYRFLFVAKGGGSANKTQFIQKTKALLNPERLEAFCLEKMKELGTAGCPPYHIVFVIGGTSAESCLKTVKLASTGYYDNLPAEGNEFGQAFRDRALEEKLTDAARELGIGAQFGGTAFAHDVKVIRLPRHGASCPVGLGVSCSADRNLRAKINGQGIWIEKLDTKPGRHLEGYEYTDDAASVSIDLNRPMAKVLADLDKHPVRTRLLLNGTIVVARDIAHARIKQRLEAGEKLPDYLRKHPVYYAGPAKKPDGCRSGSFGPTTANRMDPYVELFQKNGGSLIMLAKGNRSPAVTESCRKYGGFYLGSIGGPAALLAQDHILKVDVVEFEELGMEAVWKIEVKNFPAFLIVDNKGNDFFQDL